MSRLNGLRMENFKPFGQMQHIPLAPITLVFGPNSEGKSSILEALMVLAQTLKVSDPNMVLALRGPSVNVGGYHDMIHRHDVTRPLSLGVYATVDGAELPKRAYTREIVAQVKPEVGLQWTFGYDAATRQMEHRQTELFLADLQDPIFRIPRLPTAEETKYWFIETEGASPITLEEEQPQRTKDSGSQVDFQAFRDTQRRVKLEDKLEELGITSFYGDVSPQYKMKTAAVAANDRHMTAWIHRHFGGGSPSVDVATQELWQAMLTRALTLWTPWVYEFRAWRRKMKTAPELTWKRLDNWLLRYNQTEYFVFLDPDEPRGPKDESTLNEILSDLHHEFPDTLDRLIHLFSETSLRCQAMHWAESFNWSPQGEVTMDLVKTDHRFFNLRGSMESPSSWWGSYIADEDGRGPTMAMAEAITQYSETIHQAMKTWSDCISGLDQDMWPLWLFDPAEWSNDMHDTFTTLLAQFSFIGPMRQRFAIATPRAEAAVDGVGPQGEHLVNFLAQHPDAVVRTNQWLTRLGVDYQLRVEEPTDPDLSAYWKVALDDQSLHVPVAMDQLGYGISQVVPIVAEAVSEPGHVVVIEQPELHLHPKLQAELGSLFAEGVQHGNQFVIETHSEHLILRLQRLIRTGTLTPDEIAVLYVSKGVDGAQCQRLRLDSGGDFLDPWPDGFFEESYRELFGGVVD